MHRLPLLKVIAVSLLLVGNPLEGLASGSTKPPPRPAGPAQPNNTRTWFGPLYGQGGGSVTLRCYNPTSPQPESVISFNLRGLKPGTTYLLAAAADSKLNLAGAQVKTDDQGKAKHELTVPGVPSDKSVKFTVSEMLEDGTNSLTLEAEASQR